MTRFVIDPAALLRLVEQSQTVEAHHQLIAPAGTRAQALELLLVRVQEGLTSRNQARELHTLLTETKLRALNDRVSRWTAFELARQQGWPTLRHAEYLAVTKLQADALIALDQDLAAAAATRIVRLAPWSALFER